MNKEIKELLLFLKENNWSESAFSTPFPVHHIELNMLLDKISELFKIEKEEIGKIINEE